MYKKILLLTTLSGAILTNTAFAFSDVTDNKTAVSVNTLSSLNIVNGIGDNKFNPDGLVTRAEFAKMAVLMLGATDFQAYENFTIFPDVTHNHWASTYVNMAVKEYGIVKGFPDGTFNPNGNITYAEAITMMLYMLDYEIIDIGAYWPQDFVSMANKLGITNGVYFNQNDNATRGNSAIMLANLLQINMKNGEALATKSFPYTTDDAIILSSPSSGKIEILVDGNKQTKTSKLTNVTYGSSGMLVFEDSLKTVVKAFIPNGTIENLLVKNTYANKIEFDEKTLNIPAETLLILQDEITTYGEDWINVFNGSQITINYDEYSNIQCIIANNSINFNNTFIYDGSQNIPNYEIYKNGIVETKIEIDDVVTIDDISQKIYASDRKITGIYEDFENSFFYPTKITVLGKEFNISENIRENFTDIKVYDIITLFLDANGEIFTVKKDYSDTQFAYLENFSGSNIDINIDDFFSSQMTIDVDNSGYNTSLDGTKQSKIDMMTGQFVNLKFSDNGTTLILFNEIKKPSSDLVNSTIDGYKISQSACYFEGINSTNYIQIKKNNVVLENIPKENILGYTLENNVINNVIFKNVTNDNLDFGISSIETREVYDYFEENVSTRYEYTYHLESNNGTLSYELLSKSNVLTGFVGVQKNTSNKNYKQSLMAITLENAGQISGENFQGLQSIRLGNEIFDISENVFVYDEQMKKSVTLQYARQNYNEFEVYVDKNLQGSKICAIVINK